MRALPQVDLHPQPLPASPEIPTRTSGRKDGDSFAETLQRKSDPRVESPAQDESGPTPKVEARDAEKPAVDASRSAPTPAPSDAGDEAGTSPIDEAVSVPSASDVTAVVVVLAAPVNVVPAALTTPVSADDGTATTSLALMNGAPTTTAGSGASPWGMPAPITPASPHASVVLDVEPTIGMDPVPIVDNAIEQTAKPPVMTTANAIAEVGATNTDLAKLVAGTTPAVKPTTVPASMRQTELPAALDDTVASTTDLDPAVALPPPTSVEGNAKVALPLVDAHAPTALKDSAPVATAATIAAPTSATPATQPTALHAIAAAIGDHQRGKVENDAPDLASKSPSETLTTIVPPVASTPIAPNRPMSETVLAQNTLAAQGNAMEKAVSHQISKALIQQLPNGDRMLVLRLTPPELGTVKIEVVERMGVLTARLHAEDDGVRLALERFLPSMRQDLRANDAPIRELTLSDQTQFQRSFADGQSQQQQDADRSGNRRTRSDVNPFSLDGARNDPVATPRSAPLGGRVGRTGVDALA